MRGLASRWRGLFSLSSVCRVRYMQWVNGLRCSTQEMDHAAELCSPASAAQRAEVMPQVSVAEAPAGRNTGSGSQLTTPPMYWGSRWSLIISRSRAKACSGTCDAHGSAMPGERVTAGHQGITRYEGATVHRPHRLGDIDGARPGPSSLRSV